MYIDISMCYSLDTILTTTRAAMGNRSEENNNLIIKERKIFAKNLRNARKDADLKQRDLAEKTGLSQAFISGVETGEANVSLDNAARLAQAVGKPLRDLLDPQKK